MGDSHGAASGWLLAAVERAVLQPLSSRLSVTSFAFVFLLESASLVRAWIASRLPVSRVFRSAFHGLRVTGRLASSTRFRIPRCESARSNTRTPPLLSITKYKNAPHSDEPGGTLCF